MKQMILAAWMALSLVGCASVDMASSQQDADAKKFSNQKGNAVVYIYRNEMLGTTINMNVEIDGHIIGTTAPKTYLYKEIKPGTHTITSKAENDHSIVIDAKPGAVYYVWQEVKIGILRERTKLHLVSETEGKRGVSETKLAKTQ